MRRVATKIFLAFAVSLAAFAAVAAFSAVRLQGLRRDLRLLNACYIPLTRIAAELEVKDWIATRALEARTLDRAARNAYVPLARARRAARAPRAERKKAMATMRPAIAARMAREFTMEGLRVRGACAGGDGSG